MKRKPTPRPASGQAPRPRNSVVRALIARIVTAAGGRHRDAQLRRMRQRDQKDLDQRVREIGEW